MTADSGEPNSSLAVYDHVRPPEGEALGSDLPRGVYRVVGTADDAVTLLRVADDEGRRVHAGELVTVAGGDVAALEPAPNPDDDRSLADVASAQLTGFWWTLRVLARTVVERPAPSAVALALVATGLFGDPYLPVPDIGDLLLFLAGFSLLVYLSRSER